MVVRCEHGHFYDNSKYLECPFCAVDDLSFGEVRRPQETSDARRNDQEDLTVRHEDTVPDDDDVTVSLDASGTGNTISFTVGWLVCTGGRERGRDYRLHAGFNRIGRDVRMDINVSEDVTISRDTHFSIVYDGLNDAFSVVPGTGTLTYVNGTLLTEARPLQENDTLRAGNSSFLFVPFCKGERKWN